MLTEAECAGACDSLPACVGYGYAASGTNAQKCYVHGPAVDAGLPPYVDPGSAAEWQGYTQPNAAISDSAGGSSAIVCKRALQTSGDGPSISPVASPPIHLSTEWCKQGYTRIPYRFAQGSPSG